MKTAEQRHAARTINQKFNTQVAWEVDIELFRPA